MLRLERALDSLVRVSRRVGRKCFYGCGGASLLLSDLRMAPFSSVTNPLIKGIEGRPSRQDAARVMMNCADTNAVAARRQSNLY